MSVIDAPYSTLVTPVRSLLAAIVSQGAAGVPLRKREP
jgi:hypothetical protein